jgi:hypothetical protein
MDVIAIINQEDPVLGSLHQVTVEMSGTRKHVRLDGYILPYDHEFTKCAIALTESFNDHFAGLEDLDTYLTELG